MTRAPRDQRSDTRFPAYLKPAHELCLMHHDLLVHLLKKGEEAGSFRHKFELTDETDRAAFDEASDVFVWLERTQPADDRVAFLRRMIFPAVLSDFLHFIYEALEASRKAKLSVAYALLRKPLQDHLGVFEMMVADLPLFVERLSSTPWSLDPKGAGGLDAHTKRIAAVLTIVDESDRFDSRFLAQLRYDKGTADGFDGICNKALHLFTTHGAIQTEPLNLNFVFSGNEAKETQWYYLFSRLPYLLFYARRLVEHLFAAFEDRTDPDYLADMERRVEAATLLWWPNVAEEYRHPTITAFVKKSRERLFRELSALGCPTPEAADLARIRDTGVLPSNGIR